MALVSKESSPRAHSKKPGVVACTWISSAGRTWRGMFLGFTYQPVLMNSFKVRTDLSQENTRQMGTEK